MKYYRLISPVWLKKPVLEGFYDDSEVKQLNTQGYNVYFFPNHPKSYPTDGNVNGSHIDVFTSVFVDCDLKDKKYSTKDEFLEALAISGILPSSIVDSGHGIHAYWNISNLDAKSYLRFQRRLARLYNTDENVSKICQLMRSPGFMNTKNKEKYVKCVELYDNDAQYTAEEFDKLLPTITAEDEDYCNRHYDSTLGITQNIPISDELPKRFGELIRKNKEAKEIYASPQDDRSKSDFRLAHIMHGNGFTKAEALSVLVNSAKALQRAPIHRQSYATNIVDKIWTYEKTKDTTQLSDTVKDILTRSNDNLKGVRFPCHKLIDDTVHGFRLGQVLGIIGGSGVGKTTLTLNTFLWFAQNNPEYHHFFFSLEQPPLEIAERIRTICQGNTQLFDKIHIVSNYEDDGTFKHFSMDSIQEHLVNFTQQTEYRVGAAVIDHIGVLAKSDKNGEMDGLIGVCKKMKSLAVKVNCMLIMLSQAPREKAGIGDVELSKDAAYGTVFFESYCDYVVCMWQPLKRVYKDGAPTLMAFKFAKIRHKRQGQDRIQEDTCYQLFFDPQTELLRELSQDEEASAKFFMNLAINARKRDRSTDVVPYESRRVEDKDEARTDSH